MRVTVAFTAWRSLIGDKPIDAIRRPDLKLYVDYLRDRPIREVEVYV
jgi:hypothetical protein